MNGALTLHPKVAGGSLSACLALIVLWGVSYWVVVPPEVAAAFTAALAFVGGWLAPTLAPAPPAATP
jgi:hypothetical protein